jgi:glutaredoxin
MTVDIYGTESCTYCKQAVSLCEANAIEYNYVDVGNPTNLQGLTERMGVRPRTVPQIFLDGAYLPGGFNGLKQELGKN